MYPHLQEAWDGFKTLWDRRTSDHIAITEIEAYARIHSVYDVEAFADLIIEADFCVHDTTAKVNDERDRLNERFATLRQSKPH